MNRLLTFAILLTSTLAFANPPEPKPEPSAPTPAQAAAEKVVQAKLIGPLAVKENERSRFSRARMPAQARRVRVLDAEPKKDDQGAAFLSYAIDARHGFAVLDEESEEQSWRKDTIKGCVYLGSSEVYVQRGDEFLPAGVLMGKKAPAPATKVCTSGSVQVAKN